MLLQNIFLFFFFQTSCLNMGFLLFKSLFSRIFLCFFSTNRHFSIFFSNVLQAFYTFLRSPRIFFTRCFPASNFFQNILCLSTTFFVLFFLPDKLIELAKNEFTKTTQKLVFIKTSSVSKCGFSNSPLKRLSFL